MAFVFTGHAGWYRFGVAPCDYCGEPASHECLTCRNHVCELGHCSCPGRDDKDLGTGDDDDDDDDDAQGDDDDDAGDDDDDDDGPDLGSMVDPLRGPPWTWTAAADGPWPDARLVPLNAGRWSEDPRRDLEVGQGARRNPPPGTGGLVAAGAAVLAGAAGSQRG